MKAGIWVCLIHSCISGTMSGTLWSLGTVCGMSELGEELAAGPLSGLRLPLESVAGWTQCP